MMSDIWKRISIFLFQLFELLNGGLHSREGLRILFDEIFELFDVAPVELNKAAAGDPLENEFEICWRHRQKREQSKASSEVDRNQALQWL